MEFGQRIKNARIQRKLTQDQVAKKFFVTRQTISSWENEKSYPDIASLIEISNYYQISLDTLLKEDTGMREYLEKKEIKKNIRPVYNILVLVDLILIFTSIIGVFTKNNLNHLSFLIFILLLVVSYAVYKLRRFDESNSLGFKTRVQKEFIKYRYVIPTIFIVMGGGLWFFKLINQGIFFLIAGIMCLAIFIIRDKR